MKKIPILHYQTLGSGQPVVLIHGYLSNSKYWGLTASELAKQYRVYALDLLGFGKSPKPGCSRYDLAAQLQSIDATLDAIGIHEPVTLVGHSMGSLVALHYSVERPERVRKLLLTNMPMFSDAREAKRDVYATRLLYRIGLQPGLHHLVWPVFKLAVKLSLLPEHIRGESRSHHNHIFQNNSFSRLRSMRNLIFQARVEADLRALQVKTILLSGMSDRAIYLHNLYRYRLAKHIQSQVVAGGHHLPLTNPLLIASLV